MSKETEKLEWRYAIRNTLTGGVISYSISILFFHFFMANPLTCAVLTVILTTVSIFRNKQFNHALKTGLFRQSKVHKGNNEQEDK